MDVKKVGKAILLLRIQNNMTQKDLAQKLGITDKAVSRWERGQGAPDVSLLPKLADILNTDIENILEGRLTSAESNWNGVLILKYPEGMSANTDLYGKAFIYYQLGFFILAGIKCVSVIGCKNDVELVALLLKDGGKYGLKLEFLAVNSIEDTDLNALYKECYSKLPSNCAGVMAVDGISFLYGKDLTRCFRRLVVEAESPVELTDSQKRSSYIKFFPNKDKKKNLFEEKLECQPLERGMIMFPIADKNSLSDATMIMRILENQRVDEIGNLEEIALNRGFIEE